jgi:hypothetical protein
VRHAPHAPNRSAESVLEDAGSLRALAARSQGRHSALQGFRVVCACAPCTLRCAAAQVSYAEDGSAESDFEDAEAERRARVAKRAAAVPALLTDAVEEADEVERVIAHRRAPRGLT